MQRTMLLAVTALALGAGAPAQASSHTGSTPIAKTASAMEFSAAKRSRNPYEGRATIYNPQGAPWGPPSSPGTYGGGF